VFGMMSLCSCHLAVSNVCVVVVVVVVIPPECPIHLLPQAQLLLQAELLQLNQLILKWVEIPVSWHIPLTLFATPETWWTSSDTLVMESFSSLCHMTLVMWHIRSKPSLSMKVIRETPPNYLQMSTTFLVL